MIHLLNRMASSFVNTPEGMNRVVKYSFKLQVIEYQLFASRLAIVLVGTSTAGKTSLIKAVRHKQPHLFEAGIDKAIEQLVMKKIQSNCLDEWKMIQAKLKSYKNNLCLINAIFKPQISFLYREDLLPEDKIEVVQAANKIRKTLNVTIEEIEALLMKDIFNEYSRGRSIIFDVTRIEGVFMQCIANRLCMRLKIVLVYCPFHTLSERMKERNEKAEKNQDFDELRIGTFPFFQFAKLFGPKMDRNEIVLETLSREVVVADFKTHFDECVRNIRKDPFRFTDWLETLQNTYKEVHGEKDLIEKEESIQRENLLKSLGFKSEEIKFVEITTRMKFYHHLVDNSQLSATKAASAFIA